MDNQAVQDSLACGHEALQIAIEQGEVSIEDANRMLYGGGDVRRNTDSKFSPEV